MSNFIDTQFCLNKKSKNRIFQNFILIAKHVVFFG